MLLIITIHFQDNLWRVKRSDREISTFTDPDFIMAYMVASKWATQHKGRMVVESKDGIGIGQIDFSRLEVGEYEKEQLKLELEDKNE